MTETDDTQPDGGDGDSGDDLGGVLGEVGLDYGDDEAGDEADDTTDADEDAIESTETETEGEVNGSESAQSSDGDDSVTNGDEQPDAASESASEPEADNGPFAPESEMQLTESFGTKLTPPEKEFVELYVEFSDEYDNPGAFLREFVRQLRQEHGEEVMRRKQALEELKGGL
jgi:hypothetical protein